MMWKFLRKPEVIETTNNLAERQIRRYVIYRKNSFFTLVRTWRKIRGKNVVDIFDITSKWPEPLSKATESSSCHCLVL
nr:transposase [Rickettsia endosymbiont of Ceutorhynchus assimilis]